MRKLLSKPFLIYLLKFGGLFSLLYFGTLLIIGLSSKENLYSPFVATYFDFITPLRLSILQSAEYILTFFGHSTIWSDQYTLGLEGGRSVRMVYSCIGYGVLSFWAAFILANTREAKVTALWLISGWALLWALNVLRIVFLLLAINNSRESEFEVDHHTLYNIMAYCCIFLMIFFYDRAKRRRLEPLPIL
jgi:exosortase/archaeosortase family protein